MYLGVAATITSCALFSRLGLVRPPLATVAPGLPLMRFFALLLAVFTTAWTKYILRLLTRLHAKSGDLGFRDFVAAGDQAPQSRSWLDWWIMIPFAFPRDRYALLRLTTADLAEAGESPRTVNREL